MNGFRKLQERLRTEGWYVGWNHYCCQSCAWEDVPYEHEEGPFAGKDVNLDKVLFNHSQDCEVYFEENYFNEDTQEYEYPEEVTKDYLVDGSFVCYTPEQQNSSLFCFSGQEQGVKNLTEILPIIEECGCTYNWCGTGKSRIEISW